VIEKSEDDKEQLKSNHELAAPTETKKNKGKVPNRLPQPSDDEEEDENENDNSDSSDDGKTMFVTGLTRVPEPTPVWEYTQLNFITVFFKE
jgi:hypothetical protein